MFRISKVGRRMIRELWPQNDNHRKGTGDAPLNWMDAKALYDEAHEHLKRYETLYARAHAIDMACRAQAAGRGYYD